jgi:predicted short-subunit dehydrogenase-like oxidoreductase (DUF2520 family)
LTEVPFLIEASSASFENELLDFVQKYFSNNSIKADSKTRLRIHLAAVFANNFTNFFLTKSKDILDEAGVNYRILEPLMTETIKKAFEIDPKKSQTGPAQRGDMQTLEIHKNLIKEQPLREVYVLISKLIENAD